MPVGCFVCSVVTDNHSQGGVRQKFESDYKSGASKPEIKAVTGTCALKRICERLTLWLLSFCGRLGLLGIS